MASYAEWNCALVTYFTIGVPRSTKIYLSVDDEVLERIGRDFLSSPVAGSWREDFRTAVREKVIVEEQVNLTNLQGLDFDGFPKGVAFLGATVLATYQMAETGQISELNYFRRLRDILDLPGTGRPLGMKPGSIAEEPLWQNWKHWLMANGFFPSAQRGRGGPTTYINYPISQALLRRADKDQLLRLFDEKQWSAHWDAMTLFAYVRREVSRLSLHLKQLLLDDRQRYEAVAEAIYEVYEQWQDKGSPSVPRLGGERNRGCNLFSGLYRDEEPFSIDYYLYPKQQRGCQLDTIKVQLNDKVHHLRSERSGWYYPLDFTVSCSQLDSGARYQISSPDDLDSLILPSREFWILIPDPENPDSGVYASWGQPTLGTQFIILCHKKLLADLQRLRDERLLEWNGEPIPVLEPSDWVELWQCQVISQAWEGIFVENQILKDALQPTMRLSISFSGGLRVPQMSAWLEGHSPQLTIFGFSPTVKLQVTRLSDKHKILEKFHSTNTPIAVNFPTAGDYLVEATCAGELSERLLRIVDWSSLSVQEPSSCELIPIGYEHCICGSIIEPVSKLSLNKGGA